MIDYSQMKESFYQDVANSKNFFQSWFHGSRHHKTQYFVEKYYSKGMVIVDLGCGNVLWNLNKLPVIGVDINEAFLDYNIKTGAISEKLVCGLDEINLPDAKADVIITTEILEHIPDLPVVLSEIKRILKPGGILISSVPYDTWLSLWRPLFKLQCFYRGYILRDDYYKQECGHVNHFSPKSIQRVLESQGFSLLEQFNNHFLTIFSVFQKD